MYQIIMPNGAQTKLANEFKVSRKSVWEALTGRKNTALARMLRKAALERGGVEYKPAEIKVME